MSSNPMFIRVQTTLDPPGLRLRAQPTTASDTLAMQSPGALLHVLESESAARSKIGVNGQWIRVRDVNGLEGYVAAWYVEVAAASVGGSSATADIPTAPAAKPRVPQAPAFVPPSPKSLVDAINAERVKNKLPPLSIHPILMSSAQKHAEYMAANGVIAHESADGSRPFQRHLAGGYPLAGDLTRGGFASENIVAGSRMTVAEAITSWYGDAPHTHTMLGDKYSECGAGVAISGDTIYYCFDVARPTTTAPAKSAPATVPPPAGAFVVYVPKTLTSGLRIRKQGSTSGALIRVADPGEWLEVQESKSAAKVKLGVENQWLKIKDKNGNVGYVAAWLVSA